MKLAQYVKFREEKFCGVVFERGRTGANAREKVAVIGKPRQRGLVED